MKESDKQQGRSEPITVDEKKLAFFACSPLPEPSDWECHLFGGLVWHPLKGQEPNAFWRLMQYLCFGNRWVKRSDKNEITTNHS